MVHELQGQVEALVSQCLDSRSQSAPQSTEGEGSPTEDGGVDSPICTDNVDIRIKPNLGGGAGGEGGGVVIVLDTVYGDDEFEGYTEHERDRQAGGEL